MADFSQLLVALLLMHIVCDFYLQPAGWQKAIREKRHRSAELYFYSIMHGISSILPIFVLNITWEPALYLTLTVVVSHFVIDLWMSSGTDDTRPSYLIIAQSLYLSVYVAIAYFMTVKIGFETILSNEKTPDVILVVFAYLLILKPASVLIGSVLQKHSIITPGADGLPSGGELIGYLERVLILTFTLVGSYAAVGFVMAAKSIFRFGDLNKSNDRKMTEYVLIGSLLSVVITTLVGAFISYWLDISIS